MVYSMWCGLYHFPRWPSMVHTLIPCANTRLHTPLSSWASMCCRLLPPVRIQSGVFSTSDRSQIAMGWEKWGRQEGIKLNVKKPASIRTVTSSAPRIDICWSFALSSLRGNYRDERWCLPSPTHSRMPSYRTQSMHVCCFNEQMWPWVFLFYDDWLYWSNQN